MAMEYERHGGSGGSLGGCLSCCFDGREGDGAGKRVARVLRTSSRWAREQAGELSELVARVGRRRRRQQAAEEFRYDPISYALNFEEDGTGEGEPFKYWAFSSRLPETAVATGRGS